MTPADFASNLAAERQAARAFAEILQLERAALARGEADRLPAFSLDKAGLIDQLKRLAEQREGYLASLGLPAGRDGMKAWLQQNPGCAAPWQDLMEAAATAKQLAHANSITIEAWLDHTTKALAVLLQGAAQTARLYGPDGRSRFSPGGHSLAAV